MVVLEAKSQGTIGIVTKNTGMENIIKNNINGYTLDWDDKNLIVEKINYIYNNQFSDEINNLKNNNISETKDMTWEKAAKHIENLTLKN
jgi:glycosyltransferase involved in cell wall biosynthesis